MVPKDEKIIEYLCGLNGFDHWWDGIDLDIQKEIINEIAKIIYEENEADIRAEAINWREAMKEAEEKGYQEGYNNGRNVLGEGYDD